MPPDHHISNPADQSVDKSPCGAVTGGQNNTAAKEILENSRATAGSVSEETSEESPLPGKGREKLASLLADLLRSPRVERQPEAETDRPNLYEPMSPAFVNELRSVTFQDPQRDKNTVIYENCLKCRGARCQPPPRVPPARMHRDRNLPGVQTFLKRSQEHGGAANEDAEGHGADGQRHEEMSGRTLTSEGKRPLHRSPLPLSPQPFEDLLASSSSSTFLLFLNQKQKDGFKGNQCSLFPSMHCVSVPCTSFLINTTLIAALMSLLVFLH